MIDLNDYDAIEVLPIRETFTNTIIDGKNERICEPCEGEENPDFWSVYLHLKEGGVECVADCPDEGTADFIARALWDAYPELRLYGSRP